MKNNRAYLHVFRYSIRSRRFPFSLRRNCLEFLMRNRNDGMEEEKPAWRKARVEAVVDVDDTQIQEF